MTSTSFHNFLFLIAILFSAETVSAKKVDIPFFKKSDKITISYDEFRRMRPAKQEQWVRALQNFYVNLEKIEKGQRVGYVAIEFQPIDVFAWLKVKALVPKVCTAFELMMGVNANADFSEQIQIKKLQLIDFKNQTILNSSNRQYEDSKKRLEEAQTYLSTVKKNGTLSWTQVKELEAEIQILNREKIEAGSKYATARSQAEASSKAVDTAASAASPESKLAVAKAKADANQRLMAKENEKDKAEVARLNALSEAKLKEAKASQKGDDWLRVQNELRAAKSKEFQSNKSLDSANKVNAKYNGTSQKVSTSPVSTTVDMKSKPNLAPGSIIGLEEATLNTYEDPTRRNMFAELDGAKPGQTENGRVKDIEVKEETLKGRNSCIYAGWVQQLPDTVDTKERANRCPRISEMTVGHPPVTYSCVGGSKGRVSTEAANEQSILRLPAVKNVEANADATILCNPVVFGLLDSTKNVPLCVEPSASVTKECATQSKAQNLDAGESIKRFPDEYRVVNTRVNTLCTGDEASLRTHFKALGITDERQVENSVSDLSQTCVTLREQLSEVNKNLSFPDSNEKSSNTSGGNQ